MHDIIYFFHLLGLALGLPASFGYIFLGINSFKMQENEARQFVNNIRPIQKLGQLGIVILVLSGGYLISDYWTEIGTMPYLLAKLVLVVVLIALIVLLNVTSNRIYKTKDIASLGRLRILGWGALIIALAIMVLAVQSFH